MIQETLYLYFLAAVRYRHIITTILIHHNAAVSTCIDQPVLQTIYRPTTSVSNILYSL